MNKKEKAITRFGMIVFGALTSISAQAGESFIDVESVPTVVGVGVGRGPDYRGSNDKVTMAAPFARYTFSSTSCRPILSIDQGSRHVLF